MWTPPKQSEPPFDGNPALLNKRWWLNLIALSNFIKPLGERNTGLVLHGTQALRLASDRADPAGYPPEFFKNYVFVETDTGLVYLSKLIGGVWTWVYASGEMEALQAVLPVLGFADKGLLCRVTDYAHRLKWRTVPLTAASWAAGTVTATAVAHGFVTGQVVTVSNVIPPPYNATIVVTVTGVDTFTYPLVGNPGTFGVAGFACCWTWAEGDEGSGRLALFEVDPSPGTGWHLYDGTVDVPYLKFDGTLGLVTLPDLATAPTDAAYLKAAGTNAGPTAATAPTSTGGAGTVGNTTSTGVVNATVDQGAGVALVVALGVGVTVAAHTHVHADTLTMNAHTHTFTPTQATISDDGEPRHLDRRPFFRQ